jgi:basic membrane lipoprotein Med (substrate-binding protein (PBP1-ABC) superfamily)
MFTKKNWQFVTIIIVIMILLTSCGGTAATTEAPPPPTAALAEPTAVPAPSELNVAAILSIGLESTWDSTFYDAFKRVQGESPYGIKVNDLVYTEGAYGDEAGTVMRQYAESGKYDIIFAQAAFTDQVKPLSQNFYIL